ncbi:hypothetical protein CIB48_g4119 [Xylaria polymorpha]|nr:hypothetical protein CIB48_g4119 [Xylaria polymorpha]
MYGGGGGKDFEGMDRDGAVREKRGRRETVEDWERRSGGKTGSWDCSRFCTKQAQQPPQQDLAQHNATRNQPKTQ